MHYNFSLVLDSCFPFFSDGSGPSIKFLCDLVSTYCLLCGAFVMI